MFKCAVGWDCDGPAISRLLGLAWLLCSVAGILIAVANCGEFVLTYVLMNLAVAFCELVGDCAFVGIPTIDVAVFVAVSCYKK